MASSAVRFLAAAAIFAGVAAGTAAQSAPAPAAAGSGAYKIAVVDRKKIFDELQTKQTQWDQLEAKKNSIQQGLDTKIKSLEQQRKDFETNSSTMNDEQRTQEAAKLDKAVYDLRLEARTEQEKLNKEGERIIKAVTGQINDAIRKIGEQGNYHLILEADTAISSVVYFSTALDITSQVQEYLAKNPSAAAAPAPAAPKPAANKDKNR